MKFRGAIAMYRLAPMKLNLTLILTLTLVLTLLTLQNPSDSTFMATLHS